MSGMFFQLSGVVALSKSFLKVKIQLMIRDFSTCHVPRKFDLQRYFKFLSMTVNFLQYSF